MKLPKEIVEEGLKLAKNAKYMGIPLSELSHDELLAVAAEGWDMYERTVKQFKKDIKLINAYFT